MQLYKTHRTSTSSLQFSGEVVTAYRKDICRWLMYYYPSLSFILPLRHIFVILSQLFHSSHSFTEKKSHASNFFFFLQSVRDQGQNLLLLALACRRPLIVTILITARPSASWLRGRRILSVALPPDSKDTGGSKVQRPIYSCCSDRSIRSNYHTHKVALSRVQVIPNQPEQRSRLLFHSFLWSRATVWYAEDAPLTVIAEDNYLRLTWREIRGAPQVQMTGWFTRDPNETFLVWAELPPFIFPPTTFSIIHF